MNEQQQQQQQPHESSMSIAKAFILIVAGILTAAVIIPFLAIVLLPALQAYSWLLGPFCIAVLVIATVGALYYLKKHQDVRLEAKQQQARMVKANANNVYPAIYLPDERRFVQAINGPQPQVVPQHYSPTISEHHHNDVAQLQKLLQLQPQAPLQLPAPEAIPTGRELLLSGKVEEALREGFLILGWSDGKMVRLKIKRCFSTLVSGLPSVGKSTTVFWIAGQLTLVGARLWIVDPHIHFEDEEGNKSLASELADLADSFVFPPCDGEQHQVLARMRFMYTELRKRQRPGYIVRAKDTILGIMDEFNSVTDGIDPSVTVVVHEGRNLNFAQTLALIEREGRKYGLHFILIGHKWAKQDIGGDNAVRTNATTYLCHKLNDQQQADLLLGSGQGKKILQLTVGSYWITGPTWNAEPARITTPAISAVDLPVLMEIKRRGIGTINEANVIDSTATVVTEERDPMRSLRPDPESGEWANLARNETRYDEQETPFSGEVDTDDCAQENGQNQPTDTAQGTQNGGKYRLTEKQAEMFCLLYPDFIADKDEALRKVGANTSYRAHANELILQHNLKQRKEAK